MKTVYDMNSGQVLEAGHTPVPAQATASDVYTPELELGLQPVTSEPRTESAFPPELVLADLNAFLETMS